MKPKRRLVTYEELAPGFEGVYTGEKSSTPLEEEGWPVSRFTDKRGNVYERWCVWTWTPMHGEVTSDRERKAIDDMQAVLGFLDDETRRIRAHIGSLVLCDSGIPVTIDLLLRSIGRGHLEKPTLHNGCWCDSMWWESRSTQPRHVESMQVIESSLRAYLKNASLDSLLFVFPQASGFIRRAYQWLGPRQNLSEVQELMLERMLLPFSFFTKSKLDYQEVDKNCYGETGMGRHLDDQISQLAGLPKIYAEYKLEFRETLQSIQDPGKQKLYRICGVLAHGLHGLSDCHHSTFRWIESWIHAIGTGSMTIPDRKSGTERERLARLLFGYTLGLDAWLLGTPQQFLLLDLGHVDLGVDPKNEILRVYAYLGEDKSPIKTWLAACLWHNLSGGGNPQGLIIQQALNERAKSVGVSTREWMDAVLAKGIDRV
jgi:hypothetical protein